MKRKVVRATKRASVSRRGFRLDSTEFLLLLFVTLVLLAYFGIKMNLLPKFFSDSVLGVATSL